MMAMMAMMAKPEHGGHDDHDGQSKHHDGHNGHDGHDGALPPLLRAPLDSATRGIEACTAALASSCTALTAALHQLPNAADAAGAAGDAREAPPLGQPAAPSSTHLDLAAISMDRAPTAPAGRRVPRTVQARYDLHPAARCGHRGVGASWANGRRRRRPRPLRARGGLERVRFDARTFTHLRQREPNHFVLLVCDVLGVRNTPQV